MRRVVVISVVSVALLTALAVFLIAWVGADAALRPAGPRNPPTLEAFAFAAEEIEFPAHDGTLLAGWFVAAAPPLGEEPSTRPNPAVVIVPGYGQTRETMLPYADLLSSAGFAVLLYDQRGIGESGGGRATFGAREPLDVAGAVDVLAARRDVDPERIGLLGLAMGGSVALIAVADIPRVRVVVAEAPYASLDAHLRHALRADVGLPGMLAPLAERLLRWRMDHDVPDRAPLEAAERLGGRPVLLVDDSGGPSTGIGEIYDALPGPKTLWVAHGASLGGGLREFPIEYVRRVVDFLRAHLEPRPVG